MVTQRRFLSAAAAGVADSIERCMKQGFAPDTFSTDWNTMSCTTGGTSLT